MDGGESRCSQCVKLGLPIQICSRERLIQHKPFEKCTLLLTCYHSRLMVPQGGIKHTKSYLQLCGRVGRVLKLQ